jgi:hypothetical protein
MSSEFDLVAIAVTNVQSNLSDPPTLYVPQVVFGPLFLWLYMHILEILLPTKQIIFVLKFVQHPPF